MNGLYTRVLALIAFAGLLATACSPVVSDARRPQSRERPPSFFYRMQADFILKETGEPISFDYVVACGGLVESYSYTTPTAFYKHHPIIMFQPVGDGQALGLVSIDMCDDWKWHPIKFGPKKGQSRIPENLRPLAIWFDDINDLSAGWGYKTDDAYESPLATIEFVKAEVTISDRAAWKAWRDRASSDYQQVGALPGPWGFSWDEGSYEATSRVSLQGAGFGFASATCLASAHVRVPDELIGEIFAEAPENIKRFWFLDEAADKIPDLRDRLYSKRGVFADSRLYSELYKPEHQYLGTLSRGGDAHIVPYGARDGFDDGFAFRDIYPFLPRSEAMPETTHPADSYFQAIMFDEPYKGFGRCYSHGKPIDMLNKSWPPLKRIFPAQAVAFDADGALKEHKLEIGSVVLDKVPREGVYLQKPPIVLDRKGYIFEWDQ